MKKKDYVLTAALTFLLTILFARVIKPFELWTSNWWLLQVVVFLAINSIIITIYNLLIIPPRKAPEVPNVLNAFNEAIINSKYNFCSTSTKEIALWKSPTFLYYLNLNTLKSISEAAKGPCNVTFSADVDDKEIFYDEGIQILDCYATGSHSNILSKYAGIRLLIYPREVYEKNKEEIRSLISIHALGRIHCIPVIREALLNRLNDEEKEILGDFSNKLNQKIVDEHTELSRARRFILRFAENNPYKYTIPDFLIIDSYSTASPTAVWWYEKNKPQSSSEKSQIANGQSCFQIISQRLVEAKERVLWDAFRPSIFETVPVIVADIEKDFFSKEYYGRWLNDIVPKEPQLKHWIQDQEEEYLKGIVGEQAIDRALDIGCGWGRHMDILLQSGLGFCAGIDVSPPMIRKANHLYDKYGNDKVHIKLEDAEKLSFENESFNLVICMTNTFGNMRPEARQAVISEIYRVLRKGGLVVLSVYKDSAIAKEVREKSYIDVNLRPYPVDNEPSVVLTQEGLYSKQFTFREVSDYLRHFKDVEKKDVNELAFITRARK